MKTPAFFAISTLVVALGAGTGYFAQRYPIVDLQSVRLELPEEPVSLASTIAEAHRLIAEQRRPEAQALLRERLHAHRDAIDAPEARKLLGSINRWLFSSDESTFG